MIILTTREFADIARLCCQLIIAMGYADYMCDLRPGNYYTTKSNMLSYLHNHKVVERSEKGRQINALCQIHGIGIVTIIMHSVFAISCVEVWV